MAAAPSKNDKLELEAELEETKKAVNKWTLLIEEALRGKSEDRVYLQDYKDQQAIAIARRADLETQLGGKRESVSNAPN